MAEETKIQEEKYVENHDYDGIRELDNPPPPWLMWVLYLSIFWAAIYFFHYQVFKQGDTQEMEYQKEVAAAKATAQKRAKEHPKKEISLSQTELIELGEKQYYANGCATCHGAKGEGNSIGPNLTDEYWLHGGKSEALFKTIKFGESAHGMPSFADKLSNEKITALASFILKKLVGSNPPNAKKAQGNKE